MLKRHIWAMPDIFRYGQHARLPQMPVTEPQHLHSIIYWYQLTLAATTTAYFALLRLAILPVKNAKNRLLFYYCTYIDHIS